MKKRNVSLQNANQAKNLQNSKNLVANRGLPATRPGTLHNYN